MASKKAASSSSKEANLTAQPQKIITDEEIHINTNPMIRVPAAKSRATLGPCFEADCPPPLGGFHPYSEVSLPFGSIEPDWKEYHKERLNRLWPKPDKDYIEWVDRVAAAKGNL